MNSKQSINQSICAVVVTYHPDFDFINRLILVAAQVTKVVIVDNNSSSIIINKIREIASLLDVHLILNETNKGIATALNQGMMWAKEEGYAWVLTLDQDTVVEDFMLETIIDILKDIEQKENVAIVGSNYLDEILQKFFIDPPKVCYDSWIEYKTVITSGSLISVDAFQKIGTFRDELFIDLVDQEYCLRARKMGFKILISLKPIMKHALGTVNNRNFLWKKISIRTHAPFRIYTQTRNSIVLSREYLFEEPLWVVKRLCRVVESIIRITMFEKNRILRLKNLFLGIYHGFVGKLGSPRI